MKKAWAQSLVFLAMLGFLAGSGKVEADIFGIVAERVNFSAH